MGHFQTALKDEEGTRKRVGVGKEGKGAAKQHQIINSYRIHYFL